MARPKKQGIDYFPLDCDFFSDRKVKILKARYGADGITLYLYLLCEIYKNGYYIPVDDDFYYIVADDLGMSQDKVKQVLTFLLERSMLDKQLFQSDAVLTSAGIQRRFQLAVAERAKKNPVKADGFWLLKKEETKPFIKVTHFEDFSQKNDVFPGKNESYSREKSLKESKVNKYIYYSNPELEESFRRYIGMRNSGQRTPLSKEQIDVLKKELDRIGKDDPERIAICDKAFASGWKSFYPIRKNTGSEKNHNAPKKGANFKQRKNNYDEIEERFIRKINGTNPSG